MGFYELQAPKGLYTFGAQVFTTTLAFPNERCRARRGLARALPPVRKDLGHGGDGEAVVGISQARECWGIPGGALPIFREVVNRLNA